MQAKTQTPGDLFIRPRDMAFSHEGPHPRWWLNGDPIATAFFNALSTSFPEGERFFMDAVRPYRDVVDPKLREQIMRFTAQEALHSREHRAFNNSLVAQGYDLERINSYLKARFDFGRKLPRFNWLCATIALEHFTAILAHAILTDPRDLAGAPSELAQLWRWHAIEEIEHKAVAFDTFLAVTQKLSGLRRWWIRCFSMFFTTIMFLQFLAFGVREFFRQDGIDTRENRRALISYLWNTPGLLRRVAPAYFAYYKPHFHPWQSDDRLLIVGVESTLTRNRAYAV